RRGTLCHDVSDLDWLRASAASIGRALSDDDAIELSRALASVGDHPDVIGARLNADCSLELHRAAATPGYRRQASTTSSDLQSGAGTDTLMQACRTRMHRLCLRQSTGGRPYRRDRKSVVEGKGGDR